MPACLAEFATKSTSAPDSLSIVVQHRLSAAARAVFPFLRLKNMKTFFVTRYPVSRHLKPNMLANANCCHGSNINDLPACTPVECFILATKRIFLSTSAWSKYISSRSKNSKKRDAACFIVSHAVIVPFRTSCAYW